MGHNIAINEYGEYAVDFDFESIKNEDTKGLLKKLNIPLWKLPEMSLKITSKLRNNKDIKLFPGIIDLLTNLKKNYKLGILSSNSRENIIATLKEHKIDNLFEFVYSGSSIFGKHLVLKKMCSKQQINHEVIYVGDEERYHCIKKARIKNIAVTWGFNSKEKLSREKPDYIVDSQYKLLR